MGILIDIILIAILIISAFLGYKKGLVKLGAKLFAGIIAIIVTVSIVKKYVPKTNRIATGKASDFNGSGTSDDPYKIENIEDLLKLSENVNSGITYSNQYFELTNKLDFQRGLNRS